MRDSQQQNIRENIQYYIFIEGRYIFISDTRSQLMQSAIRKRNCKGNLVLPRERDIGDIYDMEHKSSV
jgi:hypothetical protein